MRIQGKVIQDRNSNIGKQKLRFISVKIKYKENKSKKYMNNFLVKMKCKLRRLIN